jgi:tripartite-type tricarboxylate transporter receptor subunit TctC
MVAAASGPGSFTGALRSTAWTTICRAGAYHAPHSHPDSAWSGVYYVETGDSNPATEGTPLHLSVARLARDAKVELLHVPYRGGAPAINDLLGGQTQAMFPGLAAALPHLRSGRMRALAVTGKQRSPQLKDVPTMEEIGFKGFDAMQWYGSVGPAGLPADVVHRLNETQVAVLKALDLAEKLAGEAVEPWPMSPEQFGQYIRAEVERWTVLAKARGIRLDD